MYTSTRLHGVTTHKTISTVTAAKTLSPLKRAHWLHTAPALLPRSALSQDHPLRLAFHLLYYLVESATLLARTIHLQCASNHKPYERKTQCGSQFR